MSNQDIDTRPYPDTYADAIADAHRYGYWHRDDSGHFHRHAFGADHDADHRDGRDRATGDRDSAGDRERWVPADDVQLIVLMVATGLICFGMGIAFGLMAGAWRR